MSQEEYHEELGPEFMEGLLNEFIDSSLENLTTAQELSYQLKTGDFHSETIKEIFRMFHSLKGSSAIVGCLPVRNMAHAAESLLVQITEGLIPIESNVADVIISTVDLLNTMVEEFGASREISDKLIQRSDKLITEIDLILNTDPTKRLHEILFNNGLIDNLKESIANERREDSIKRLDHLSNVIKNAITPQEGNTISESKSVFDELKEIEDDTEFPDSLFEEVLSKVNDELQSCNQAKAQKAYKEYIDKITAVYELSGASEFLAGLILDGHHELQNMQKDQQMAKPGAQKENSTKTMRVPEAALDDFIQMIGDLIIVREMIDDSRKRIDNALTDVALSSEMKRHMDSFAITLSKLENSAMTIRKQSVKMLLNKMSRLAREVATKVDKVINFNITGSETLIDKSLLELLEAPLIHIVNNAVDHGLENSETRLANGKSAEGNINVNVVEDDEDIIIEISDDGQGMNFEKLREKGKEMGATSDASSHEDLLRVIFLPGFSTAAEVTDISGRGVGMDVVKKELEKAGGTIEVKSETGVGSKFILTLPKSITTQIIQGYLMEVAGEPFIVPVKAVRESFHPEKANIVRMYDQFDCLETRGEIMPIVKISEHLYGKTKQGKEGIFIIVEEAGRNYALLADKVIGIQQVVLKELKGLTMLKKVFSGAALMGNGNVALVLDLANFLETSVEEFNRN